MKIRDILQEQSLTGHSSPSHTTSPKQVRFQERAFPIGQRSQSMITCEQVLLAYVAA